MITTIRFADLGLANYCDRDLFLASCTLQAIEPAILRRAVIVSRIRPVAGTIAAAIELYVLPDARA